MDEKAAVLEGKGVEVGFHNGRVDLFLLRCVLVAAVHEAVFLPRVTMEVAVEHEVPLLLHTLDELLGVVDGWVELLVGVDPLSVEIDQIEVAAIVADDDSIGVEHGHDLKDEILPEDLGDVGVAEQVVDDVLDNIRRHRLSGVHSGGEEDALLLLSVVEIADDEIVAVIASDGLAEGLPLQQVLSLWVNLQLFQEILKAGVGVGIAVGNVDSVAVIFIAAVLHGNLTEKVKVWKKSPFFLLRLFW